jgi:hypothetical protein
MMLLLIATAKASLIVGVALAVLPLLRSRAAALRHLVLAVAILCALLMPALQLLVPVWGLPSPTATFAPAASVVADVTLQLVSTPARSGSSPAPRADLAPQLLLAIWMLGTAMALAAVGAALVRLARTARRTSRAPIGRCR